MFIYNNYYYIFVLIIINSLNNKPLKWSYAFSWIVKEFLIIIDLLIIINAVIITTIFKK